LHGTNGKDAFNLTRRERPFLIISDIMMPKLNGYELCKAIKTDDQLKGIPVILLTVLSDSADIIKGLECGADNFITKPYNEKYLLSRIHNIIINNELRKEQLSETGMEVFFANKKYYVNSDRVQILDLLLSTYENSIQKNRELIQVNEKLKSTSDELETLNKKLEEIIEGRTLRLKHINKVLVSIRNVNQLIVREKDEGKLIKSICSSLVTVRGYKSAWILLFDENINLLNYASKGTGQEFSLFIKNIKNGKLPYCCKKALKQTGIVLASSQEPECSVCPNVKKDTHWESMTIRLEYNGDILGFLTIKFSSDIKTDEEEQGLLYEVAGDISFALHNIFLEEERIYMSQELKASLERFKILFDYAPDAYYLNDLKGNLVDGNKEAEEITGYKKEELIGMNFLKLKLLSPSQIPKAAALLMKNLAGIATGPDEFILNRHDGTRVTIEIRTFPVKIQNQKLVLSIARDITRRKNMENELILAKEQAEEANRLKSAFLANMSHEIRTPMNALLGFSSLLADPGITDEKRNDFIPRIRESGDRLLHLIDDIIDSSKIEAGQLGIKVAESSVNKILTELCSSLEEQKHKKGKENIEIRLNKAIPGEYFKILTDPYRLKQILSNLLDNALKYTDSGYIETGYTVLPAPAEGSQVLRFYVKDTGIGFPENKKDFIFERFHKIEDQKVKLYEGAGLGLAISKNLVKLLGGEMWAESELGNGSAFYFTLPYKPVHDVQEDIDVKDKITKDISGRTIYLWKDKVILIAEDDENNYSFIKEVLTNTCAKLIRVKNGQEAVEICRSHKNIDLILMDVKMPLMDGYTATKSIKSFRKNLPVIALTAYAGEIEKEDSRKAGCDDYLSKPVKSVDLLLLINKYF